MPQALYPGGQKGKVVRFSDSSLLGIAQHFKRPTGCSPHSVSPGGQKGKVVRFSLSSDPGSLQHFKRPSACSPHGVYPGGQNGRVVPFPVSDGSQHLGSSSVPQPKNVSVEANCLMD